jgi:adenylate kinase
MIVVILGPQGSGKGTQAKMLVEKLGLFYMESGKLLREVSNEDVRIKNMLDNGILVPTGETIDLMKKYIRSNGGDVKNILFDGFPRTLEQHNVLQNWLSEEGVQIDVVIYLDVGKDESVKRLSARRVCSNCGEIYNLITNPPKKTVCDKCGSSLIQRDDDKPDAIKKRLDTFYENTEPLVKIYKDQGVLIEVDGERPIEVIFTDILKKLEKKSGN